MAQRFGGKYSPDTDATPGSTPRKTRRLRVDPVGGRVNLMFLPPVLLAGTSLIGGAGTLVLGLGGAFGRGALQVGGSTVDYYSTTSGSAGLQIGAQQYSHVLFFMTQDALQNFRSGQGWAAGADITYAINDTGEMLQAETTTSLAPVIAVVFAQAGLRVGATLEGTKYSRIIP